LILSSICSVLYVGTLFSLDRAKTQEAARLQKPLQYEVSVTLKLIQVYVTDRKGHPIEDLSKDDFAVFDNGQAVTVTEFERHTIARPPGEEAPVQVLEALVPTPLPPQNMNRKFFFFFDYAYNNQRGILKSKEAAIHFLDNEIRPDDEVAILSYSMIKGVSFHEYLTTDHRKIRETLSAINGKAIAGRAEDIEQEYWMRTGEAVWMMGDSPGPAGQNPPQFNWRRQESKRVVENYIDRLTCLAKALRLVAGQKHFIFFSSGIPTSMIYGNQVGNPAKPLQAAKFDPGDYVLRTANEAMLKELSNANCVVYSFDTRESAKVPSLFAYDEITMATGYRDIFSDQGVFQATNSPFKDDKVTGLDSLKRLSDITGGKYYSNINMYARNLDQVQNLTGTYYVLGYYIGEQWDGRFHATRIEVKRRGCEVRAQAGYYNPKPFREYSDLERQVHLFDLALNERSSLGTPKPVSLTALAYDAGEKSRLQLISQIGAQALEDFLGREVEFVVFTFDEQENLVDLQLTHFDFTGCRGRNILFSAGTVLSPGSYKCRLVIRDQETGMSALGSTRVSIGRCPFAGLTLDSPLLLLPNSQVIYLETAGAKKPGGLAWRDAYPFDRARYSPVVDAVPRNSPAVLALVPYTISRLADPAVVLSAYLINSATGERIPVRFYLQNKWRQGAAEFQFLEFSLSQVPQGKYFLYLHAEDTVSQSRGHIQTKLVVQ
jgi:VWFA-related protein